MASVPGLCNRTIRGVTIRRARLGLWLYPDHYPIFSFRDLPIVQTVLSQPNGLETAVRGAAARKGRKFQAGVRPYAVDYDVPDYVPADTDLLCAFRRLRREP